MFFLEVGYKIKKKRRGGMSMRKKMKLFIAMVSVGVLLGTIPVMAAEQPELPTKVQDIANGSDDLYGEGVPIEHGANPDERFSSGGADAQAVCLYVGNHFVCNCIFKIIAALCWQFFHRSLYRFP